MPIDTKKVEELNQKLSNVNLDISQAQESLDNLKGERKRLETEIRTVTSGRKTRSQNNK